MHNVYLLAPKNLGTPSDMFSDYCKTILEIKFGDVKKKKIPNLGSEINYKAHYVNLQLYLSLEMKLNGINKVLKFKQSDWIKIYIDLTPKKDCFGKSFSKF